MIASGNLGRFTLLCLGVWLHAADSLLAATVMPSAVDEFGGIAFIHWGIALYQLGAILCGAVTGALVNEIGLRRGLILAAVTYALGCLASGAAPDMATLLVGRLLQGLGGGWMIVSTYIAADRLFPRVLVPRAMSVVTTIWGGSALCGPLIGGLFAESGHWRWAFHAFALQGAVLALAGLWALPAEPSRPIGRALAVIGARPALAPLTLGTLAIALAGVAHEVWAGATLAILGIVLLVGFALLDRVGAHRLLTPEVLNPRHPIAMGMLASFALSAGTMPFTTHGPVLLAGLAQASPLAAGYALALEAVAWTLASVSLSGAKGPWRDRVIRIGTGLVALSGLAFPLVFPLGLVWPVLPCVILQGAGFGMASTFLTQRIVNQSQGGDRALVASARSTVLLIGNALGAAASGIAANAAGLAQGPEHLAAAAIGLFGAFAPVCMIGAWASWRLTQAPDPGFSGPAGEGA